MSGQLEKFENLKKLILFGGTTEAREILERGIPAVCCVATDYGAELVKSLPGVDVRVGRLNEEEMISLIRSEDAACVIDATHPYAVEVSKNIRAACARAGLPLLRLARDPALDNSSPDSVAPNTKITRVNSCREAAELLNRPEFKAGQGGVLLTVGSKELREFVSVHDYQKRLFARVLPTSEVLRSCEELGFDPGHVLAMRGPFSLEMNRAMLQMTGASVLVTKDGGAAGGMDEKLAAAQEAGVEVILITRPEPRKTGKEPDEKEKNENESEGLFSEAHSVDEAVLWARRKLNLSRPPLFPMLLDLEGRDVLVVGGGAVAMRRAGTLLKCGARVRAVSPVFRDDFPGEAGLITRPFSPDDLDGAALVTAASDDRDVNALVGQEARKRGIPVSVADAAGECNFFFPALISSGGAAVSVSTAGMSCAMTKRLADRLRSVWGEWVSCETQIQEQEEGRRHEA